MPVVDAAGSLAIAVRGLGKRYRLRHQGQTTLKTAALRLLALNPVAGIVETFRAALFGQRPVPWEALGVSALVAALILLGGLVYFRRVERSFAVRAAHSGKAVAAASMARRVSAAPRLGTVPIVSPVAGFVTAAVPPPSASIHAPST
jgi:hypothetical protein